MPKVEIRTGVWIAYEDHWFGKPWTVPEIVLMVHGNAESSLAWAPWVPHLASLFARDLDRLDASRLCGMMCAQGNNQ